MASMADDRFGGASEDEVVDVADDVIYVDDADAEVNHLLESVWASVVTGAHYAFRSGMSRRGGADGTGAG
jgi:hypothetical protein